MLKYFLSSSGKVDKSMFSTFERIKDLAKKRGISLQNVATDLGFSVNYMYSLKTKKTPSAEHIAKIADYRKGGCLIFKAHKLNKFLEVTE